MRGRLLQSAHVKDRLFSCPKGVVLRSTAEPLVVLPTPPPTAPRYRATAGPAVVFDIVDVGDPDRDPIFFLDLRG
jgi:hypothetical protein